MSTRLQRAVTVLTVALLGGIIASLIPPVGAQTPIPHVAPAISFTPASGSVIKTSGLILLSMTASTPEGLKSVSFAGANRAVTCYFSSGTYQSKTGLFWNTAGYANGLYTFTGKATDVHGLTSTQTLTVDLEK